MSSKRFSLTVVGFSALAVSLVGVSLGGGGAVSAGSPSDTRAVYIEGNVPPGDCQAGGTAIPESALDFFYETVDGNTNASVTITGVDAGYTIQYIYVKGGDDTNLYQPGANGLAATLPYADLISPLNNGGNVPTISHWFACGTTTIPTTTGAGSTTTTAASTSTTTTAASTTTTASSSTTSPSTTVPETTTTTGDSTTTTTGDSTTTTTGDSTTTTTGDSTTTTTGGSSTSTGGSSTTTGGSSTVVPPPYSTMPNTGAGDSSNLIGAALLALLAGAIALLFARRQAA